MNRNTKEVHLAALTLLHDNWDGEGAPAPSAAALERTAGVLAWAKANALCVDDVDADVLGGVAIWLGAGDRRVWISCMNDGRDTVMMSRESREHGIP